MAVEMVKVMHCTCERCGHRWRTRTEKMPEVCASCKSPYWARKRMRAKG